ncbi:MAG: sigma-70 family RNA polymerase sigma factor [Planctomycetota bacterium]|jgi:RNA polymerase sigma factor (sigma-70 family)
MRKIKNHNLAQLLMQLRFTPEKKRRKQLDAAEKLFAIIDTDKEYPFEFVCFRITGFHLKIADAGELIKGGELMEDLRIFISKLSGKLALPVTEQNQEIYGIEELAKTFEVSTKTIYRWRKQGLIARKYIFDDGIRRFGFLQSNVDEFLDAHPDLAGKAKDFSRLTDKQKQQIVKQALKLASGTNLSRYQIIDKISAKTGKCHETIRYTLLNYENANPGKPIFKKSTGIITPAQAAEIYRLFKQGCSIKELMKRFERNKSSIYRIINRRRAKALLAKKIEYVDSDEFLEQDVKERILAEPIDKSEPSVLENVEPVKLTGSSLSDYLHTLTDAPVLNREDEIELFRRYNYLKFLAGQNRADIKLSKVSGVMLTKIESYLARADEIKRRIIEANLRLVVNIARKHTLSGANLLDLVSEGNISLMSAVEKFDYTRGFRFSTFASWTITKDYARKIPDQIGRLGKSTKASLANIHREMRTDDAADFAAIERAHHSLTQVIKDNLTKREQYVIMNRFGLVGPPIKKETKTLLQIGEELDLSKERIRQIELVALQKLRQSLSPEEFELLTG